MLSSTSAKESKEAFLEATKAAREARKAERDRERASVTIQSCVRGWLARRQLCRHVRQQVDAILDDEQTRTGCNALTLYHSVKHFLSFCDPLKDEDRMERIVRCLVASLAAESPKISYVGVALGKEHAVAWIAHIKVLLHLCLRFISSATLRIDTSVGSRKLTSWLSFLVAFTSPKTWTLLHRSKAMEQLLPGMDRLCENLLGHLVSNDLFPLIKGLLLRGLAEARGVQLKNAQLVALLTLTCRPVVAANFSDMLVSLFTLHVLSVPALIQHLQQVSSDMVVSLLISAPNCFLSRVVQLLCQEQQLRIHFNALEGSYALCLTANLVHLCWMQEAESVSDLQLDQLTSVIARLMDSCGNYVSAKQSNLSHWHSMLGWFSMSLDQYIQDSMQNVKAQLSKLWSPKCLRLFARPLLRVSTRLPEIPPPDASDPTEAAAGSSSVAKELLKRAVDRTKTSLGSSAGRGTGQALIRLGSPELTRAALLCCMYQNTMRTLNQLRLEILSGLSFQNVLIEALWVLLCHLGPQCGLKVWLEHLTMQPKGTTPEFQLLMLFANCLTYLLTFIDDVEMYEKQKTLALGHYVTISAFVNAFLYRAVSTNLIVDDKCPLFVSMHSLLMVLYSRDCRRPFARHDHWLIKECKASSLMAEVDKGRRSAAIIIKKMPHVLPHADRVVLFRKKVAAEKASLGSLYSDSSSARSTLITIHRSRIVEDGYNHFTSLSGQAMKGVIRVKFINAQGLDEAGIDQDGVFKEFLEETVKRVFDPGLNLFCATSDQRLYPSPLSNLTDNHLHLFEFVGKMIGKAVYEGIVIDVPFAAFFVSQILGVNHANAFYSYADELASFDADLYRNLTYVKHYDGDVADLNLTFSFDQDVMGQIVTHELIPGGKRVAVTDENKFAYIHLIAQFRMHVQIKDQIAAFRQGFRSIINPDWLKLFSPPEVMRLISGDNSPLDLKDLRKHTHYYGGFHDSHRVINWLWDILEKDFDSRERSAFLKFVTSCSKPPLLGFEHLEPPFSIRCVEVGDDEDEGDTVASLLRGFLALGRRDPVSRLPTASTCFNLLKLPNYQKKSTLRDKLRYAVANNTGFELS